MGFSLSKSEQTERSSDPDAHAAEQRELRYRQAMAAKALQEPCLGYQKNLVSMLWNSSNSSSIEA